MDKYRNVLSAKRAGKNGYTFQQERAIIVRTLALFPFFGMLIPDFTFILIEPKYKIPLPHLLICLCLLLIIIVSFVIQLIYLQPGATASKAIGNEPITDESSKLTINAL